MRKLAVAACLAWAGLAAAQSLLDDYGRVITIVSYSHVYVGETLLACAARGAIAEGEAERRYQAYQARNAAVVDRAETWKKRADERLAREVGGGAARERAQQAEYTALSGASAHAQKEVGSAADPRALCAERAAAIDEGRYDLGRNRAFIQLLED